MEKDVSKNKTNIPSQDPAAILEKESNDTTHFSVIDNYGNSVSVTLTLNFPFGSGYVPRGTGVMLNNEMEDFILEIGVPNAHGLVGNEANLLMASKRPLSSMTPTIVRNAQGRTRMVVGGAGGPRITTSVFLTILNRYQFGMSLPDAISSTRFHHQWKPIELYLEKNQTPKEIKDRLAQMGYQIKERNHIARVYGLEQFPDGRVWGLGDPRSESAAIAQ